MSDDWTTHDKDPEPAGVAGSDTGGAVARRQATALSYEHGDHAPRVLATGSGHIAEAIIAAAEDAGIPVRSDPALAAALAALELGNEVPEALYRAVAEALAWAYKLDAKAPKPLR